MKTGPYLTSVGMNTDLTEAKIHELLDGLPERIPDEIRTLINGLADHVVVVNNATTFPANGPFGITLMMDFDAAAYDKVLTAVRALKADIAH